MKKRFLSLLCVLALCLGLLPVTALAVETNTVYVGGVALAGSSDSIVYATTNESGEVITEGATADNYNIKWDGSTLTLHDATIQKELNDSNLFISGSAIGVINQNGNAELTIQLEGSNTIEETNQGLSMGIYVYSSGGGAALNIKGNGTLVLNSNYQTIQVISSNGNAALSIENAKVTATSSYGFGVTVRSGSSETSSASLTVDGGSLTATAQSSGVSGIRLLFGTGGTSGGTPTVTVSNNTIVRANGSAGGITSNSSTGIQYETGGKETGGIIWNGTEGTVYGNVTLQEDLEIGEGESLTIENGASLNTGSHEVIVNGGTLTGEVNGQQSPQITTPPQSQIVTEGESATFTIEASGSEPLSYQWQESTDSGSNWKSIAGATSTSYEIATTSTDMSDHQYRCVVTASGVSVVSDAATLTVTEKPEPTTYTITADVDPAGAGTVSGGGSYAAGTSVTLTATPNSGYRFVGWVEGGTTVSTNTSYIFNADKNRSLTAQFDRISSGGGDSDPTYSITLPSQVTGGELKLSRRYAEKGETVTLTAIPDEGYKLDTLTVTDSKGNEIDLTDQGGNEYTFKMPAGRVTIDVTFRKTGTPLPFADVGETYWAYDEIAWAYENGYMSGTSTTAFTPGGTVTRQQVWMILARAAGANPTDMAAAKAWAVANGISDGTSPGSPVTRQQLAALLYRYAVLYGYDVSVGENTNILSFTDVGQLSEYAIPAMQWAVGAGIINGTGDGSTLTPQGDSTRAQLAVMLYRFMGSM